MTRDLLALKAEAQEVLDVLLSEKVIPFALRVGKLTEGINECTLHFYDSRIHTARIPLDGGLSFRDKVREAVLARVGQMSDPLPKPRKKV